MTLRERIADWILTVAHASGWRRIAEDNAEACQRMAVAFDEVCRTGDQLHETTWRYRLALEQIERMETPSANATVRRMAATAREALK